MKFTFSLEGIKKFAKKLEKISSLLLVIITGVLVGVTVFYALHTRQMADTMKSQFSLSFNQFQQNNRPYIFLDDFEWGVNEWEKDNHKNVLFTVFLKNSGNIPARVLLEKYSYVLDGKEYTIDAGEGSLSQGNLIVFPGPNGIRLRQSELEEEQRKLILGKKTFEVILRLSYWSIGDKNKEKSFFYEQHIEMIRDPEDNFAITKNIVFIDAD